MKHSSEFRVLLEKITAEDKVRHVKLPVPEAKLKPVLSKDSIKLHYGTLYKNYVEKSKEGKGDFFTAGAVLHSLFFEQFKEPDTRNRPIGLSELLINNKFGSFDNFKELFTETALGIEGSSWIYLDTHGKLKTIPNHKIVDDVAVIVDMWEHSYVIDYGSDKEEYLRNIWSIINWEIVNKRLD